MFSFLKGKETSKSTECSSKGVTTTEISEADKNALDVVIANAISGSFRPSGLNVEGVHYEVEINDSTWTPLPATPLAGRNQINIQNFTGVEIKINFDVGVSGYVGMRIPNNTERFYQVTDSIIVYAKSSSGTVDLDVEELA